MYDSIYILLYTIIEVEVVLYEKKLYEKSSG